MQLPNFAGEHDVDLNEILALFDDHRDNDERKLKEDQRMAISSLWFLSGKTVTIRMDGKLGNTVIDYREPCPMTWLPWSIPTPPGGSGDLPGYRAEPGNPRPPEVRRQTLRQPDRPPLADWRWQASLSDQRPKLVAGIAKTSTPSPVNAAGGDPPD